MCNCRSQFVITYVYFQCNLAARKSYKCSIKKKKKQNGKHTFFIVTKFYAMKIQIKIFTFRRQIDANQVNKTSKQI